MACVPPRYGRGRLKETVPVRLHHFSTRAEVTVNHDQIPNHGEGRLCVVREQCPIYCDKSTCDPDLRP